MQVFRIHGAAYDVFDTMGTVLHEGRWHSRGTRVVYAAEHVSLAALQVLIHAESSKLPPKALTRIHLADKISTEDAGSMSFTDSQLFGDRWIAEKRSAILRVPSVITNGLEFNCLLNPAHPDFRRVRHNAPVAFPFDERFFSSR
jgi:RES domain-containing protein